MQAGSLTLPRSSCLAAALQKPLRTAAEILRKEHGMHQAGKRDSLAVRPSGSSSEDSRRSWMATISSCAWA